MIDHRAHIEDLAVKLYTARRLVKPHAYALDYLARRHSLFYLADRTVFKCKFDHFLYLLLIIRKLSIFLDH